MPADTRERITARVLDTQNAIEGLIGDGSSSLSEADDGKLTELRQSLRSDRNALAALPDYPQPTEAATPQDADRVELRNAASLTKFVTAAVAGHALSGAEAELAAEINLSTGIGAAGNVRARDTRRTRRASSRFGGTVNGRHESRPGFASDLRPQRVRRQARRGHAKSRQRHVRDGHRHHVADG